MVRNGEFIFVVYGTVSLDAFDDLEPPVVTRQRNLATPTAMSCATPQPQGITLTGVVGGDAGEGGVVLVQFASKITTVRMQGGEDVVVFWLCHALAVWVA